MAGSSNFWTSSLTINFYQTVAELRALTEMPSAVQDYRGRAAPDSQGHVLSFQDELQISDNLAFLCHWDEGVENVSTVTLQEHSDYLVVLLACNSTPSDTITRSLRQVLAIVSEYATQKKDRQAFYQRLFREVLELSKNRIVGRLRPSWVKRPLHVKKERPSLQDQIRRSLKTLLRASRRTTELQLLLDKTEELIDCLEPLNRRIDGDEMNVTIESIVNKCVEITTVGGERSIRAHLTSLRLPRSLCEATAVHQIDKLARYHFLCRDLLHIARKPDYEVLLKRIDVACIEAFPGIIRPSFSTPCFVHAEIQQALHYERNPYEPAPRAIGCSKSACYLCDLFILKQNRYRVSHAHRRLYEKWTVPDVDWMNESQANAFRSIIQNMIQELNQNIIRQRRTQDRQAWRPYPLESRAFLPLSSGSTLSTMVQNPDHPGTDVTISSSLERVPLHFKITDENLPFCRAVRSGEALDINIAYLCLSFEFVSISYGQLSISSPKDPPRHDDTILAVSDIPKNDDMKITCPRESSQLGFCILLSPEFNVQIDFQWSETELTP